MQSKYEDGEREEKKSGLNAAGVLQIDTTIT